MGADTENNWRSPETAPKESAIMILGDFGWPWVTPAVWNREDGRWETVDVAAEEENGVTKAWVEVGSEPNDQLRRWMPMPSNAPGKEA